MLKQPEYFGQYGRIIKLVLNTNYVHRPNSTSGPCYSAYITYTTPREASIVILVD